MNNLRLVIGVTGALLLLAGCGRAGTASSSPSPVPGQNDQRLAYLQFAQCMRSHGQPNFPDPVQESGDWGFPATAGKPIAPAACEAAYRHIRSVNQSIYGPASGASVAALRAFASCMRGHGLSDWPDPTSDGHFALPGRYAPPNGNQLIATPLQACPHAGIKIELPRYSGRS